MEFDYEQNFNSLEEAEEACMEHFLEDFKMIKEIAKIDNQTAAILFNSYQVNRMRTELIEAIEKIETVLGLTVYKKD